MQKKDIEHLAMLARIKLSDAEKEGLAKDVTDILAYVGQVDAISATEKEKKVGAVHDVMRTDEPSHEPGAYTEDLLSAAPRRKGQYIEVKKILGGDSQCTLHLE